MSCPHAELRRWFRRTFRERGQAVREGRGPIDWTPPDSRVLWTEILVEAERLGLRTDDAVEFRLWWDGNPTARCLTCGVAS